MQVTNLDYSEFLGRIAIARVFNGTLHRGEEVGISKLDGKLISTKITKLYTFRGLERDEAETVVAGDIVAIAGVEGIQIGESITSLDHPSPLEPLTIDEPTLAMIFSVNSGPLSGREGTYLTSRDLTRPSCPRIAHQRFDSRRRYRHARIVSACWAAANCSSPS